MGVCFVAKAESQNTQWELRFVFDPIYTNHVIGLAKTASGCITAGQHSVQLEASAGVPVDGVPSASLGSLGVLEAILRDDKGEAMASVKLVTDVRQAGEGHTRVVLDPFS